MLKAAARLFFVNILGMRKRLVLGLILAAAVLGMVGFVGYRIYQAKSAPEQLASPPKLENLTENTLAAASLWLFAVDDGSPQLAVSAGQDQEVVLGRFDPDNPTQSIDWKVAISKADSGGQGVADHWHIFAHDLHWIVFSTPGDQESYLATFNKNFNRTNLVAIENTASIPTNDTFLVAEKDGVAVGHFLPGTGHKIFRFDRNAELKGTVDVGGGQYAHTNGSSAEMTETGFIIFATETLAPDMEGGVKKIVTDLNWKPLNAVSLLQEAGKNIVMATSVLLENGYRVVNARVRDDAKTSDPTSPPAAPAPGQPLPDDAGAIVRYIISPDDKVVSQETLAAQGANRPHTLLVGDLLITTWDSKSGVKLRIDKVSF